MLTPISSRTPKAQRRRRIRGLFSAPPARRSRLIQQELDMFHKIMEGMRRELNFSDLLKLIVTCVTRGLGYDRAGIFLLDSDRRHLSQVIGIDARGRFETGRKHVFPVSRKRGASVMSDLVYGYRRYFYTNRLQQRLPGSNVAKGVTCNANVPIQVGKGRIIGVLAVDNLFTQRSLTARDITVLANFATQAGLVIESIRLHDEVRHLSVTDELTGVFNRRYFDRRLQDEINRCRRYQRPLGLVYLDLDRFKSVNDRYGHAVGDVVLRFAADLLARQVRNVDTVARIGGEEFAVILPETDLKGARILAERLLQAFRETAPPVPEMGGARVTMSAGVAAYPGQANFEELLRAADRGLYQAKAAGRNQVGPVK